jgi:hypothetical protein
MEVLPEEPAGLARKVSVSLRKTRRNATLRGFGESLTVSVVPWICRSPPTWLEWPSVSDWPFWHTRYLRGSIQKRTRVTRLEAATGIAPISISANGKVQGQSARSTSRLSVRNGNGLDDATPRRLEVTLLGTSLRRRFGSAGPREETPVDRVSGQPARGLSQLQDFVTPRC